MPSSAGPRPELSDLWQELQARVWKTFSPFEAREPPPALPLSQDWHSAGSCTTIQPIIPECLVPQYSAQKSSKRPVLVGSHQTLWVRPGTTSALTRKAGTNRL